MIEMTPETEAGRGQARHEVGRHVDAPRGRPHEREHAAQGLADTIPAELIDRDDGPDAFGVPGGPPESRRGAELVNDQGDVVEVECEYESREHVALCRGSS